MASQDDDGDDAEDREDQGDDRRDLAGLDLAQPGEGAAGGDDLPLGARGEHQGDDRRDDARAVSSRTARARRCRAPAPRSPCRTSSPTAWRSSAARTAAGRSPGDRTAAGRTPAGRTAAARTTRTAAGRTPAGRTPAARVPAGAGPAAGPVSPRGSAGCGAAAALRTARGRTRARRTARARGDRARPGARPGCRRRGRGVSGSDAVGSDQIGAVGSGRSGFVRGGPPDSAGTRAGVPGRRVVAVAGCRSWARSSAVPSRWWPVLWAVRPTYQRARALAGARRPRRRPRGSGRPGGAAARPVLTGWSPIWRCTMRRPQREPMSGLPERVTIYEVGPARRPAEREDRRRRRRSRRSSSAGCSPPGCRSSRRPASCTRSGCRSSPTPRSCMALLGEGLGARPCPVLVPNERGLDRALELGLRHVAIFGSATETFAQQEPQPQPGRAVRDVRADRRRGPATPACDVRAYVSHVLRRPVGGRRARSTRWSASASGSSTSAPASSASATPSASAPPATSPRCSTRSTRPGIGTDDGWPCTSTTPTARRWPTPSPRCAHGITHLRRQRRRPRRLPVRQERHRQPGHRGPGLDAARARASRPASTSTRWSRPASGWPACSAARPLAGRQGAGGSMTDTTPQPDQRSDPGARPADAAARGRRASGRRAWTTWPPSSGC